MLSALNTNIELWGGLGQGLTHHAGHLVNVDFFVLMVANVEIPIHKDILRNLE